MHTRFGTGGYTQSEPWVLLQPRRPGTWPLIVVMHGAGGDESFLHQPAAYPAVHALFKHVVDSGFAVLSVDNRDGISADGSHTWGNDGSTTTVDNAIAYAQSSLGVASGDVILLGTSMGCLTGLNYWRRNPSKVRGMVAVSGAVDIDYHHSGNDATVGKYQTQIDTAYAGGWAAAAATHDPNVFALADPSTYTPLRMYHAVDDAVVPYARTEAFADALDADFIPLASGAHTDAAWALIDAPALVTWLRALPVA